MTREAAASVVNAEAQSKTFPPLDPDTFGPQLVWFALTFGLLFLLVQRVILPRIDEVMKGRRDRISADENRAEELKGDTQSALADHERAIAEAKAEAAAITESMRQELLREKKFFNRARDSCLDRCSVGKDRILNHTSPHVFVFGSQPFVSAASQSFQTGS